jgi:tartrate-resistant acid phosphatase type 5
MLVQRLAAGILVLAMSSALFAQQAATGATDAVVRLPDALRVRGRAILAEADSAARARLIIALLREQEAASLDFALALVEVDPSSRVRRDLGVQLARNTKPQVRPILERAIANDVDPEVSIAILDALQTQETQAAIGRLTPLLQKRIAAARHANDVKGLERLELLEQRYINLRRGTMLPRFLQTPPPVFTVDVPHEMVRVLAFGDWGTGSETQTKTAAAMQRYHASTPFDLAVTLGDNFYSVGVESPSDARWTTQFEDLYGRLKIPFYATLGNHDWGHPDSPAAEVLYTQRSPVWRMPATYYTFVAGPMQFFALDTNVLSAAQMRWLERELTNSRARWKVVIGHHHIYSATRLDNDVAITELLPILRNRADVYVCGHDHNLQHLKPDQGVHFFVAGGGGAGSYALKPYDRALFGKSTYGFAVLEGTPTHLTVRLIEHDLTELYSYSLTEASRETRP